eukprot:3464046-Rhodomonas_salina.3
MYSPGECLVQGYIATYLRMPCTRPGNNFPQRATRPGVRRERSCLSNQVLPEPYTPMPSYQVRAEGSEEGLCLGERLGLRDINSHHLSPILNSCSYACVSI